MTNGGTVSMNGSGDVKKYELLQLSPENENAPSLETPQLRKSLSLDSRNSYKVLYDYRTSV